MKNQKFAINLTIQFDNPVHQKQWGAPVLITEANIVTDDNGASLYQPAIAARPACPDDVNDALLAAIQSSLGALGLNVTRKGNDADTD